MFADIFLEAKCCPSGMWYMCLLLHDNIVVKITPRHFYVGTVCHILPL